MRVLTWNLFHGRAVPPAGESLLDDFAATLAGWDWDVALLQEVPPWWPEHLARACAAQQRTILTSRNGLLCARRLVAERFPDLIRSNGGGANTILVRGAAIVEHRQLLVRRMPERRRMHAVRLGGGEWIANMHLSTPPGPRPLADLVLARSTLLEWASGAPCVLGGDLNLRKPAVPDFLHATGNQVDHVWTHGFRPVGDGDTLERGKLSDHAPLTVAIGPID